MRPAVSFIQLLDFKHMTAAKCWICGSTADTAEHVVKKTDLIRIAGSKRFGKHNRLVKHTADGKILIQGPKSFYVKYEKSLCKKCNNEATQPFDRAYDRFVTYIVAHNDVVLKTNRMRFNSIFRYDTKTSQENLFKYFVKSFGCQLVEHAKPVPVDLVDLLKDGNKSDPNLKLAFSVRNDVPKTTRSFFDFYQVHDLEGHVDSLTGERVNYMWAETMGYLRISYWYKCEPVKSVGVPWQGNSKQIVFGECE